MDSVPQFRSQTVLNTQRLETEFIIYIDMSSNRKELIKRTLRLLILYISYDNVKKMFTINDTNNDTIIHDGWHTTNGTGVCIWMTNPWERRRTCLKIHVRLFLILSMCVFCVICVIFSKIYFVLLHKIHKKPFLILHKGVYFVHFVYFVYFLEECRNSWSLILVLKNEFYVK